MKLHYCTLFNSAYLAKGVAMYQSLNAVNHDFHLYVFAFDDLTFQYFATKQFPNITVISLSDFEDVDLLRVKNSRTSGEYCWTCTSSTILYCIEKFHLDHCTYVDADMIFYSDPLVLHSEMDNHSILITEHRYTPAYDQSKTSGIYCVQYISFKNDVFGMEALRWWRNACIDWCYNRLEDGKFGDQKYLDDWTTRFQGVAVLQHQGGGVAPWNVQQYNIGEKEGNPVLQPKNGMVEADIVFFHFHGLRFFSDKIVELTGAGYQLDRSCKELLYKPYAKLLFRTSDQISSEFPEIVNANGISQEKRPSHQQNIWIVFKTNFLNRLRYALGRRAQFRRSYNHLYLKEEL